MIQTVLWTLVLQLLAAAVSATDHMSCTTSSDLQGQPASVTCHFPHDMAVSRDSFRVYKLDFSHLRFLPETVLECYWYDGDDSPHCGTVDGYQFNGPISDTATLTIPVSSQHHAGVYRCDYISQDYSPDHGCDLYVRGRTISCTGATVYEGDPANVTCHYNSDLSVTHDSFYIARQQPGHSHYRDVLTCMWLERELTKPDCSVHPAFKLSDKISHTVTIQIPAANQSHVGRYSCDVVPTRREVTRSLCYVEVKGPPTPVPHTFVGPDSTATTTTHPQGPVGASTVAADEEKADSSKVGIIAGVVVLVIVLMVAVVVVVVVYCYRKRRQDQNKPEQQTGEATDPMLAVDNHHARNPRRDPGIVHHLETQSDFPRDQENDPDLPRDPDNGPDLPRDPENGPDLSPNPETEASDP